MKIRASLLIWGLMGLFILGFMALRMTSSDRASSENAEALPVLGQVPDFSLTERSGKTVSGADLRGKLYVADFIFTSCSSVCPMMTMKMSGLEASLRDLSDLRFVSFTVDPVRDTPAKLKAYAAIYTKEENKWFFLTGPKAEIYRLSNGGFKLSALDLPANQVTPGEDALVHSERFVLVDREGQIRGYYSGTDSRSLETLKEDIRDLVKNPSNRQDAKTPKTKGPS